jgi:hypothetical protein
LALGKLLSLTSRVGAQVTQVFIFSDSQTAIGLAEGFLQPNCHFRLVSMIRSQLLSLRGVVTVAIAWIPGHLGVSGNVKADRAAGAAATLVGMSTTPGQPLVPYSISRSLCLSAIRLSWQSSWFSYFQSRVGLDTLGRLHPVIGRWPVVFLGSRVQQTLLVRLRFGHCCLNVHMSRFHSDVSHFCACGQRETVAHFLLRCRLYVA